MNVRARRVVGMLASAPWTFVALVFYVLPLQILGWHRYIGWRSAPIDGKSRLGSAPCWTIVEDRLPWWLFDVWLRKQGQCVGTAVILRDVPESSKKASVALAHQLHHVHQLHLFGSLQPLMFFVCALAARLVDERHGNPFEIAARRASNQVVDGQSFIQGYAAAKNTSYNGIERP